MAKTYSKRVFSGKDVPFNGMRQDVGKLHRGDGVSFCVNLGYDGSMVSRNGGKRHLLFDGAIREGSSGGSVRTVCEGANIHCEAI